MPTRVLSNQPMHIHPRLEIYVNGHRATVPANVGIDPDKHVDHSLDKYSGGHGPAPIHTHDATGTLHVESSKTLDWRLGDFFKIWGLNLKGVDAWAYVGGKWTQNVNGVPLKDGQRIGVFIEV